MPSTEGPIDRICPHLSHPTKNKKLIYGACTFLSVNLFTLIDLLTQIPYTADTVVVFMDKRILV